MAASACTLLAIGAASSVVVQPATRHAAVRGVRMSTTGQDASASSPALSKWSAAVPFLSRPAKLDGSMVGDCGFDPAGLSEIDGEYINLKWMREAEIKHGRVAMLATAGWLAVDFGFKLPGDKYAGLTSLNAHAPMVESGDMVLMLLAVAFVEATFGAKIFQPGHTPGAYGWDPLDMGKEDSEAALKELKNGRLAMIAFSGIVTQATLTGSGFPYV